MPPVAVASSSTTNNNRRQPTRQARTSITRPVNYYARQYTSYSAHNGDGSGGGGGGSAGGGPFSNAVDAPPGFFPAITHFTDSLAALPKEVIGQLGMLKEVEVKIHGPNDELRSIMEELARMPPAEHSSVGSNNNGAGANRASVVRGATPDAMNMTAGGRGNHTAAPSVNGSVNGGGSVHNGATPVHFTNSQVALVQTGADALEEKRRELFARIRFTIRHMSPALDEKVAVLATANQTLASQLARMKSSFPYISEELSEEARLGSSSHWAYIDKEANKKTTGNERSRRDAAAASNLAAAAAAIHESDLAASRSEQRREAMMAKRARNQHIDSDFDDRPAAKKIAAKAKKPADASADKSVGLGISGASQPSKRRKTEKAAAMAPAMERTISDRALHTGRGSPRETPSAEPGRKKAGRAPAPIPVRKRSQQAATSPPAMSSPLIGSSKDASSRPTGGRVRQNSTTNALAAALASESRGRPSSSASNRPSTAAEGNADAASFSRPVPFINAVHAHDPEEGLPVSVASVAENRSSVFKREGTELGEDEALPTIPVVTRAGRISKTATPTVGTFPESVTMGRSRSMRGNNHNHNNGSGASSETATGVGKRTKKSTARVIQAEDEVDEGVSVGGDGEEDDVEDDGDEEGEESEERYCYCQQPSFGEMIGCENDDCPTQWFHLKCLNMDFAPDGAWYCDECAKKLGKERSRGRR